MRFRIVVYAALASFIFTAFAGEASAQVVEPPAPQFDCSSISSGNDGDNTFFGGPNNDCWNGLGGNDGASGGGGHDRLTMGTGGDVAQGGQLQDVIRMDAGNDLAVGDEGDDFIYLGSGKDEGQGNDGDDTIAACDGQTDTVKGGPGRNTCYLDRNLDNPTGCDEKHYC